MSDIFVLYGSQTGNGESIAQDLAEQLNEANLGVDVKCMPLNQVRKEKISLKEKALLVGLICATTGNGDAPENAESFWRMIKLRSAAKDMFDNLPYCVLGLGDTNYDKFCHMGKAIDKRMNELGGNRMFELACADEGTGTMESTVEAWKDQFMKSINDKLNGTGNGDKEDNCNSSDITCDNTTSTNANGDNNQLEPDNNSTEETSNITSKDKGPIQVYPDGVESLKNVAASLDMITLMVEEPEQASLPRVPSNTRSFELLSGNLSSSNLATAMENESSTELQWTAETPFEAPIIGARWLTTPQNLPYEEEKSVIEMKLSLSGSGIKYIPGDSIGICCPNKKSVVKLVISRLSDNFADTSSTLVHTPLTLETCITTEYSGRTTVGDILEYKLDLSSPPKKACVAALANCCINDEERKQLLWLCSKHIKSKKLWNAFIEDQVIGVGELLALFPSCRPSLALLMTIVAPLAPRYYSIASSPLVQGDCCAVAFSVVRYVCGGTPTSSGSIRREGLCTTYLERLLKPLLEASTTISPIKSNNITNSNINGNHEAAVEIGDARIRMFHKPSLEFHLPTNVATPVILIGPGTGVAPFIGFLEHRSLMEKERETGRKNEVCSGIWRGNVIMNDLPFESINTIDEHMQKQEAGPMWLFYGCRNEKDFLYRSTLQGYVQSRILKTLEVALSRQAQGSGNSSSIEKVYVQHRLKSRSKEIAELIVKEGACVYVCGDGNHMAKDVLNALKEILSSHNQLGDEGAAALIDDLKLRRRLVLDIWS